MSDGTADSKAVARADRVSYLTRADVDHVVARIPESARVRLRDIFFSDKSYGVRRLGWVTTRGRRDVTICSVLPVRVSLTRYLHRRQAPAAFGAWRAAQWTPWAVRRFLLYDVLLHEIGHLQVVDESSSNPNRRYASETLATEFADLWRHRLWAKPDPHPDPVHNPPTEDETSLWPVWDGLDKAQRADLVRLVLSSPHTAALDLEGRFGSLTTPQQRFLVRSLSVDPEATA